MRSTQVFDWSNEASDAATLVTSQKSGSDVSPESIFIKYHDHSLRPSLPKIESFSWTWTIGQHNMSGDPKSMSLPSLAGPQSSDITLQFAEAIYAHHDGPPSDILGLSRHQDHFKLELHQRPFGRRKDW